MIFQGHTLTLHRVNITFCTYRKYTWDVHETIYMSCIYLERIIRVYSFYGHSYYIHGYIFIICIFIWYPRIVYPYAECTDHVHEWIFINYCRFFFVISILSCSQNFHNLNSVWHVPIKNIFPYLTNCTIFKYN